MRALSVAERTCLSTAYVQHEEMKMVDEVIESSETEAPESAEVEQESTTPTDNAEQQVDSNEEETKESSNVYDDKTFREEADKIRESTKHKVSRKYEKDLEARSRQISELEEKLKVASTPPDDESVYDDMLGQWCSKNMSVQEYRTLVQEKQTKQREDESTKQAVKPLEERAEKACKALPEFESTMTVAVKNEVVSPQLLLAAAQEDGSLEMLYDLVKTNSPKLDELSRLPPQLQGKEIWKLTWAKNSGAPEVLTSADTPIKPESESATVETAYDKLNYRDGYKEFLKRKERGRG